MRRLRGKLTYANVVSTLCLFLLLGGGAALAATQLPKNSVGTQQLKNGAVTATKVKPGALSGDDINAATLGNVPSATRSALADHAKIADEAARAGNSDTLQGRSASSFLSSGATAADSSRLGGLGPSSFLGAPVVVHTETAGGFQTGSGDAIAAATCGSGETAVSGGFREAGANAGDPGLGFDGTFRLLASGPAVQGEDSPAPALAGEIPRGWYIELSYAENGSNPEVLVYVDCVPSR
ncbi:MAG TPA: hypothetical protein VGH58_07080 [Solirubrobacterales bacterium]|jgi:hypothetical protein